MGVFRVRIEIGDPQGQRYEPLDALVDTGAIYTLAPGSLLRRLGVTPHERVTFTLADGSEIERDVGQTWARVDGRSVITMVVFGQDDVQPLLGAYTLEGVRLAVDAFNRRLVPTAAYLLYKHP